MDKAFFNGKKILITGATGVIGVNLYLALKDVGAEIHLNHLSDIEPELAEVLSGSNLKKFDICDLDSIKQLEEYDVIFHCSGYGQPKKFTENPEKTFLLNTSSLVGLVNKVKVGGHFLFVSTSELYVNSPTTDESEFIKIDPNNSRNCYILGKLCGEQLLGWAAKSRGINFKNVRVCLAFGPYFKRSDSRVLTEIIFKALTQKRISLMDDGSAIRRYIYIENAIEMLLNILVNGKHDTYNLGGKEELSILELANIIARATDSEVIVGQPSDKLNNSPSFAGVSIDRYEQEFGTIQLISIKDGIDKCVEWAKNLVYKPDKLSLLDTSLTGYFEKYAKAIKNTYPNPVGAEFGVACGGGLKIFGEIWKDCGTIYGFDTFSSHPKFLANDDRQRDCMDKHYEIRGIDCFSFGAIQNELDRLGLSNVILKRGVINEKSLDDVPPLHYVLLDLDIDASMQMAWNIIQDKLVSNGIIFLHDCCNDGSVNYQWYMALSPKNEFNEIERIPGLDLVVLQKV